MTWFIHVCIHVSIMSACMFTAACVCVLGTSSLFPVVSLGFIIFGGIFACGTFSFFFNPTIQEVTFRLHGWCMLSALLLPALTGLGHECQDLLSLCDGMSACTHWTSFYTLIRNRFFFLNRKGSQNPC